MTQSMTQAIRQGDLESLTWAIQYRRKDGAGAWITMAAFDVQGPAEHYFHEQGYPTSPWEYRLVEIAKAEGREP